MINDISYEVERFIFGVAKKLLVANKTARLADIIYNGTYLSTPTMWLGVIAYTI